MNTPPSTPPRSTPPLTVPGHRAGQGPGAPVPPLEGNAPHTLTLPPPPTPARGSGGGGESISAHAKALYRMLLPLGALHGTQAPARTGLPPHLLHQALSELTDLGLVSWHDGRAGAIPYNTAIDNLLAAERQALAHALQGVQHTQRRLRLLIGQGADLAGDSAGTVLCATGPDTPQDPLQEEHTNPLHDLAALHPGVRFSEELLDNSLKRAQTHLLDGVRLRVVHQRAAAAHPHCLEYFHRIEQLGGQVRLREILPFRLMLIDQRAAVCRMTHPHGPEETLLLQGTHMLDMLGRLFESMWIDALPLAQAPNQHSHAPEAEHPGGAPVLSGQHQAIMRYLADGATDQAIARFLGITTRTVTRRVNEIYQTLGVTSRFQAGATARRMGLI